MKKIKIRLKYFIKETYRKIKYRLKSEKIVLEEDKKKVFIFLAADYGNIGDIAITYAQRKFLKDCLPNYQIVEINLHEIYKYLFFLKKYIKKDDIITIIGGGNMTNRYDFIEEVRRMVIKAFKNNRVISFPQTVEFTYDYIGQESKIRSQKIYSKNKNLVIFARENKSFEKMKEIFPDNKIMLCPDIVMYLKGKLSINESKRNKIGICLRNDKEKFINAEKVTEKIIKEYGKENIVYLSTHTGDENYQPERKMEYFFELLDDISKKEIFITDRLHGMIFCYLTNTPCVVFDNDNHKISETYNLWLKDCNYIKLLNENELQDINKYFDKIKNEKRNDIDLESKFNSLKKVLMEK